MIAVSVSETAIMTSYWRMHDNQ